MGSCAAPSAKGDDKFITTDYLQQCPLGHADAAALNQFDIDISKAQAPEARTWLLQNKAEFIALILGIEVVKVG
ncbi:hypothetical protein DKC11_01075 (plasmid) [Klebsiella quasipneumoniae]|uniref:Uncharacterized protein n=1 Tax=Klebsiella quasipneumoniae TaxID=1463165 RepID=A0ABM6VHG9_9ENTR|nr:hypothetical protein [Klebsiella quasipneumoniae]AWL54544.1 hypothetical protein DKC11_01075 [Klebsiella quasipneumoniae]